MKSNFACALPGSCNSEIICDHCGKKRRTTAKAKGRESKGKGKDKGKGKGKDKYKKKKKKGAHACSDGSETSSSGDENRAAAMALRAGGDVRDLSLCMPEPESPARSPVSLNSHGTVWEPWEALADSWTLIECVWLRTWSPGMFGW